MYASRVSNFQYVHWVMGTLKVRYIISKIFIPSFRYTYYYFIILQFRLVSLYRYHVDPVAPCDFSKIIFRVPPILL